MPGVQNPHWLPWPSASLCWTACKRPPAPPIPWSWQWSRYVKNKEDTNSWETLHRELPKMRIWIACVGTSTVVTARPCIATTGARQALTLKKEENFKFNQKMATEAFTANNSLLCLPWQQRELWWLLNHYKTKNRFQGRQSAVITFTLTSPT